LVGVAPSLSLLEKAMEFMRIAYISCVTILGQITLKILL
jgi:hypothetical protein